MKVRRIWPWFTSPGSSCDRQLSRPSARMRVVLHRKGKGSFSKSDEMGFGLPTMIDIISKQLEVLKFFFLEWGDSFSVHFHYKLRDFQKNLARLKHLGACNLGNKY